MDKRIDLTESRDFRNKKTSSLGIFSKKVIVDNHEDLDENKALVEMVLTGSAKERQAKRFAIELYSTDICERCGVIIKPWEIKNYALCNKCDEKIQKRKDDF